MKTQVLRASIVAMLVAAAGHAQSTRELRANIPFNFVAGSATLPAGYYTVNQGSSGLISMNSPERKASAFVSAPVVNCARNQSASRLVFHRYGTAYLLSQIWTAGNDCGREVPVASRERELAAKHRAPDETVVVALR
jgi:hypothetical protein